MNQLSNDSILDTVLYLYSPVQDAFHVETLGEHLSNNYNILWRRTAASTAYLVVAIFPDRDTYEREHKKFRRAIEYFLEAGNKPVSIEQANQIVVNILKGN